MIELGGWGVVAVVVGGGLLVWQLGKYAKRKVRRQGRKMLMILAITGYTGAGVGSLGLGGFIDGDRDRCESVASESVSVTNAPAHVVCTGTDRVREAWSAVTNPGG